MSLYSLILFYPANLSRFPIRVTFSIRPQGKYYSASNYPVTCLTPHYFLLSLTKLPRITAPVSFAGLLLS